MIFIQENILNVSDLKEIHSEIQFQLPDPIRFTNSHDGVDMVSLQYILLGGSWRCLYMKRKRETIPADSRLY